MARKAKGPIDPVDASNRQILADRQARLDAARPVLPDLGLGLKAKPAPANATEFMDEFDKKAFGYEQATITKMIYGPDPLVDYSPSFREALERYGREDLARLYAEAILKKGAEAMPDPLMAASLARGIDEFGRDAVASAFCDRILRIPFRTVEIDASDELDPEILGSAVLGELVRRHQRPGMEYRFFTKGCLDRFGWRGYAPVKENGDIVSAGTLMLGEIRTEQAAKRRRRNTALAKEKLDGIADNYAAAQEAVIEAASRDGTSVAGISGLDPSDELTAHLVGSDDTAGYAGQSRRAGVHVGLEEV